MMRCMVFLDALAGRHAVDRRTFIAALPMAMAGTRGAAAAAALRLTGVTLRRYTAPEAVQGVAVDADHFYVVANRVTARYRKDDGAPAGRWRGAPDGPITHLNSCVVSESTLLCANSNFPEKPMASSVEIFDAASFAPVGSHSLGITEEGSLAWVEPLDGGYLAGFAHYDGDRAGDPGKDHRDSSVVRFDADWRRLGGWMYPDSMLDRLAPASASGGALGPDGLLYVMGHDRPEMYVLARPYAGPKLVHLSTIAVEAQGQAFAWDRTASGRIVYAIDRARREVLVIDLPEVAVDHPHARAFR